MDSILTKTNHENYEIVLVNNNYDEKTFQFLEKIVNNEKLK